MIACTGSEGLDHFRNDAGGQGMTGAAGSGVAGALGGVAGGTGGTSSAGAAGTTGAGGTAGAVGTVGAAGSGATAGHGGTTGSAGSAPDAGSGSAGTAGKDGGAVDTGTVSAEVTYANTIGLLLTFRCGGCHFGTTMQGGFSVSYANVMAKVSAGTSNCSKLDATKMRIVPGKPDASLIYIKTSLTSPPSGCGGHMPYANSSLLPDQLASLQTWILQGAKP
jgi:hypothetical protein